MRIRCGNIICALVHRNPYLTIEKKPFLLQLHFLQNRRQTLSQFFNGRVIGPQHVSYAGLHPASGISHSFVEVVREAAAFERSQSFVTFHACGIDFMWSAVASSSREWLFSKTWSTHECRKAKATPQPRSPRRKCPVPD